MSVVQKGSWCVFACDAGLPVQVRDAALKIQDDMPKSDVNKEFYTQNMEREVITREKNPHCCLLLFPHCCVRDLGISCMRNLKSMSFR